ncbi:MAG: bifunctional sulfate adenylyltransferase/adenylylsulfate kinase [Planctomycetota bacterium]
MTDRLIPPHGGELVNLIEDPEAATELRGGSRDWPSWDMNARQTGDIELMLTGAFSPLTGFLGQADYDSVVADMRLADGTLWPMPVVLDVSEDFAAKVEVGGHVALRDPEGVMLAVLDVTDKFTPDREADAQAIYKTTDTSHPGVARFVEEYGPVFIGGTIRGIQVPLHHDFRPLRMTPAETRHEFARLGWRKVLGCETRKEIHRAQVELILRASKETETNLLIQPSVGLASPGDREHYTRIRAYQAILPRFPRYTVKLSILSLSTRYAGPREALWHAIVRKNFGCSHFLVMRDHASPPIGGKVLSFYGPQEAYELVAEHEEELGVTPIPGEPLVYVEDLDAFRTAEQVPAGMRPLRLSDEALRERLHAGRSIPEWFTFPEVASELVRTYPPRHRQGFTVFLSGLSGSGKSTIANALLVKLLEMGDRPVTLLDGDIVRRNLSSELGFSKEHRDLNILRIGFVASEITKNGGIALCAPIAPYTSTRKSVRDLISGVGGYVLVHVSTPLEVCEQRDRKGLYAKARAGIIPEFTGISDPYEVPEDAEVRIDTTDMTPEESANRIILHLERLGYIGGRTRNGPR